MNPMIKSILLLTAIAIPAIGAVSYDGVSRVTAGSTSMRAKDATRFVSLVRNDDLADLPTALVPSHEPAVHRARIAQAFGPPPAFGGPPVSHGAFAPMGPHRGMAPPPPPTRASCEDRVNVEIGMAAYIKARLRLQPGQREAWEKLETAAQSAIDKVRAACARFPADASASPSLPEILDAVEADLSTRAELLRTTREPLRVLFASLTPAQRLAAQPFLPPPHSP